MRSTFRKNFKPSKSRSGSTDMLDAKQSYEDLYSSSTKNSNSHNHNVSQMSTSKISSQSGSRNSIIHSEISQYIDYRHRKSERKSQKQSVKDRKYEKKEKPELTRKPSFNLQVNKQMQPPDNLSVLNSLHPQMPQCTNGHPLLACVAMPLFRPKTIKKSNRPKSTHELKFSNDDQSLFKGRKEKGKNSVKQNFYMYWRV